MGNVLNIPESDFIYEFMVIIPRSDGDYDWHSNHTIFADADLEAQKVGGFICHDIRISGKKMKKGVDK